MRIGFQFVVAVAYVAAIAWGLWYVFSGQLKEDRLSSQPSVIEVPIDAPVEVSPEGANVEAAPAEPDDVPETLPTTSPANGDASPASEADVKADGSVAEEEGSSESTATSEDGQDPPPP